MEEKLSRSKAAKRELDIVIDEERKQRRCLEYVQIIRRQYESRHHACEYERLALISPLLVGDVLALFVRHLKWAKDLQSFCLTCKAWSEAVTDNATLLIERRQWKITCITSPFLCDFHTVWVQGPRGIITRAENILAVARLVEPGWFLVEPSHHDCLIASPISVTTLENGFHDYLKIDKISIEVQGITLSTEQIPDCSPSSLRGGSDLESTVLHVLCRFQLTDLPTYAGRSAIHDPRLPEPLRRALIRWDKRLAI